MAKSSIHIQAGSYNFFRHNDRSQRTKNSIFNDEKNEFDNDSEKAYKIWRSEVDRRSEIYTKRTGRKLHKKTLTHLSAIVNLNQHHTLDDVKRVADHIEREFGAKVVQIAIHRDEGHVSDAGEAIKNYHAHIEMTGIDAEGNSVRRKLDRAALIRLQTKTAELLQMQRGTNYTAERKARPKRLDTYEYKEAKQQTLAKLKDVQAENKRLREQLKQAGAGREQYAELEAEIKQLRDEARAKELTVEQLQERVRKLEGLAYTGKTTKKKTKFLKRTVVREVKQTWKEIAEAQAAEIDQLQIEIDDMRSSKNIAEATKSMQDAHIKLLESDLEREKQRNAVQSTSDTQKDAQIRILEAENKELKAENSTLKQKIEDATKKLAAWRDFILKKFKLDLFKSEPPASHKNDLDAAKRELDEALAKLTRSKRDEEYEIEPVLNKNDDDDIDYGPSL